MTKAGPDVIVIGGGVIGLACAWRLAQKQAAVRVYERSVCGAEASSASLGVLAPPSPLPQKPLHRLHRRSLSLCPAFCSELRETSGIDVDYKRCGSMEVIPSQTQFEMARKEVSFVKANLAAIQYLPDLDLISRAEVQEREPNVKSAEFGALVCPSAARVSVQKFIAALKESCLRSGVEILEQHNVSAIDCTEGRVRSLTVNGCKVQSRVILAAGGAWNQFLDPALLAYSPIRPVRGQALLLEVEALPAKHIVKWQRGYVVPWDHKTVAVGSTTERKSGFNPVVTAGGVNDILNKALTVMPVLSAAAVFKTWAGLRPAPLDQRPIMGPIPGVEGLFAAAGHYKIGFGFAPVCAELMAEAILGSSEPPDLQPFLPRIVGK